jgi:hypothetical protein
MLITLAATRLGGFGGVSVMSGSYGDQALPAT